MAVAAFVEHMEQAIHHSVMSAFEVFGMDHRRGHCLQYKKWTSSVSETFLFLDFRINTFDMTVSWPREKRQQLHELLTSILERSHPRFVSPREMARVVGIVRSASEIAPWGTFLSFNLQNALTTAARNAFSDRRSWWTRSRIYLSSVAISTIRQLLATLLLPEPEDSKLWSRPIALYLDRDYTHTVFSDASYGGLRGWSADFSFLWRLARETLVEAGFNMREIHIPSNEPGVEGLHINPLEYVGALINLWLAIKCVMIHGPIVGGYILALFADNTTALSWMSTAARTKNPLLQGLARLGSALLVHAAALLTKVCPVHIAGIKNGTADALSRPQKGDNDLGNSLGTAIATWSQLQTCRICLLPFDLLSKIASVISSPPIGAQYDIITTELLTLEPNFCRLVYENGSFRARSTKTRRGRSLCSLSWHLFK